MTTVTGSTRRLRLAMALATTSWAAMAAGAAMAQAKPADGTALGEIVVTAQRVEESSQRAAIAITAVGSKELNQRGVNSVSNLTTLVPALQVDLGSGPYMRMTLRGVSSYSRNAFADQAIATNLDGVYMPRPTSVNGVMFDLERVEVLKGPQGTLYGRNATGGAINIVTKNPVLGSYSGSAALDIGNYQMMQADGVVNLPLGDALAARVAVETVRRDGYFDNGTGDDDRQSGRVGLLYKPSDDMSFVLKADYTKMGGKGPGAAAWCVGGLAIGTSNPNTKGKAGCGPQGGFFSSPWTSIETDAAAIYPAAYPIWKNNDAIPDAFVPAQPLASGRDFQDNTFWSVYGQSDIALWGGNLTILPAYRHEHINYYSQAAGAGQREENVSKQFSLEARYTSDQSLRLKYILGAYYLKENHSGFALYDGQGLETPPTVGFFPPGPNNQYQNTNSDVTSTAAFVNATFKVTDSFRLNGGLRYTYEQKETNSDDGAIPYFVPGRDWAIPASYPAVLDSRGYYISPPVGGTPIFFRTHGKRNWDSVTWKLGAEWDAGPNSLIYANASTGFKSGGFFFSPIANVDSFTYRPEKLTAYSVGTKNRFAGGTVLLNAEAFYWIYKDQQVAALAVIPPFIVFPQQNAQEAVIKGVEVEAAWRPVNDTLLHANVQYMTSRYNSFTLISAFPSAGCKTIAAGPPLKLDCSGLHLWDAPDWTATAGIAQTVHLANDASILLAVDTKYETQRLSGYNTWQIIPKTTRTDASITYQAPEGRWSVQAYVRNIEDKATPIALAQGFNQVAGLYSATLRPPRTYGVKISANF